MIGEVIRQINNLRITKDAGTNIYRVYSPNDKCLYQTKYLHSAVVRCESCLEYTKQANYYYGVFVDYACGAGPRCDTYPKPRYDFYFRTTHKLNSWKEVKDYARKHNLFEKDTHYHYVDNIWLNMPVYEYFGRATGVGIEDIWMY